MLRALRKLQPWGSCKRERQRPSSLWLVSEEEKEKRLGPTSCVYRTFFFKSPSLVIELANECGAGHQTAHQSVKSGTALCLWALSSDRRIFTNKLWWPLVHPMPETLLTFWGSYLSESPGSAVMGVGGCLYRLHSASGQQRPAMGWQLPEAYACTCEPCLPIAQKAQEGPGWALSSSFGFSPVPQLNMHPSSNSSSLWLWVCTFHSNSPEECPPETVL